MSSSDFSEYFQSQARRAALRDAGVQLDQEDLQEEAQQQREIEGATGAIGGALVHQGLEGIKPAAESLLKTAGKSIADKLGFSEESQEAAGNVVSSLARGNISEAITTARAGVVAARESNVEGAAMNETEPQLEEVSMGLHDIVRDPSLFRQYVQQNTDSYGELAEDSDESIEAARQELMSRTTDFPNVQETFMREAPSEAQVGDATTPGSRVLAEATQTRGESAAAEGGETAATDVGEEAGTEAAEVGAEVAGEVTAEAATASIPVVGPLIALGLGLATILGGAFGDKHHDQRDSPLINTGVQFGV